MSEHSNRFNDRFLRRRLAENQPDPGFEVKDANRAELQYTKMYKGVIFVINRDHAFRDHATGPTTNPRFGGPPESVEAAIIEDAFLRWKNGLLKETVKIAAGGPGIIFRHIPIRYNAIMTDEGSIVISDYMVWQGTVGDGTWEKCVSSEWNVYS